MTKSVVIYSRPMRITIVIIAIVELLTFGGMMLGFNSLNPALITEKYFAEKCRHRNDSPISGQQENIDACPRRNQLFGFVLLTVVITGCLFSLPIGLIFDNYGHYLTKWLTVTAFSCGCLLFALSPTVNWLMYPGAFFLSISAQSLLTANFAISFQLAKYRNLILSIMSGAFDSGAGLFSFLAYLHNLGTVSVRTMFLAIGGFGDFIMLGTIFGYLRGMDKRRDICEIPLKERCNGEFPLDLKETTKPTTLVSYISKRYPTVKSIVFSRYFIMQLLYDLNLFFRFSFFLAQLSLQITHLFPSAEAHKMLVNSAYVIMLGGFLAPVSGLITDFNKNRVDQNPPYLENEYYKACLSSFSAPMLMSTSANTLCSILILLPYRWAFYVAVMCMTTTRAFLFSINAGFILQAFPQKYFGVIYGLSIYICGSVTFIQYGLLFTTFAKLTIVNYVLIALSFWNFLHPTLLLFRI